jgi:hypothetical protein
MLFENCINKALSELSLLSSNSDDCNITATGVLQTIQYALQDESAQQFFQDMQSLLLKNLEQIEYVGTKDFHIESVCVSTEGKLQHCDITSFIDTTQINIHMSIDYVTGERLINITKQYD